MTLPPFMYVLAFWQALTYVVAALVAAFTSYQLEAGIALAVVLAILKLWQIVPQIKAIQNARIIKQLEIYSQKKK